MTIYYPRQAVIDSTGTLIGYMDTSATPNVFVTIGAVTSASYAGFTDVTAVLDALNTADTLAIRDVSASDIKEATLAILAGFWNLPVTPQMFGAKGDFSLALGASGTDDTTAIQNFVNAVVQGGLWGHFGAHNYWITAPIEVGSTGGDAYGGWLLQGAGATETQNPGTTAGGPGTNLVFTGGGVSLPYLLRIRRGALRHGIFQGFALKCKFNKTDAHDNGPSGPASAQWQSAKGIFYEDLYHSAFAWRDIAIWNCEDAIHIPSPTSASNGEFTRYERVYARNCKRFFYQGPNAGQAFGHRFESCGGGVSHEYLDANGFTAFYIDNLVGGGGGINIHNFDGTVSRVNQTGITTCEDLKPAVFLFTFNMGGTIRVVGGRYEGLTGLFKNTSAQEGGSVVFDGMTCAGLYSGTANPFVESNASDSRINFVARDCKFPISSNATNSGTNCYPWHKSAPSDRGMYKYERCGFYLNNGLGTGKLKVDYNNDGNQTHYVEFEDCMYTESTTFDFAENRLLNLRLGNGGTSNPTITITAV